MEEDLRARLTGDAAIAALVKSAAIAWGDRPQASGLPAITLDYIDDARPQHMAGFQALRPTQVQVDVWADDRLKARDVRELVIAALAPVATVGATRFSRAFVDRTASSFEGTDTGVIYRERIDFTFWSSTAWPVPIPLAVSTFQLTGREYSIGGVAKTLSDLWPDLGILTVTNSGLECNYAGGTGTASQSAFASGALFAAVKPIPGNTAVFDIDLTHDPLDDTRFETRVDVYLDNAGSNFMGISVAINDSVNRIQFDQPDPSHPLEVYDVLINGFNRIAVSFDEALVSVSANGSPVSSFVPTSPNFAGLTEVSLFFVAQSVLHPSVSRLRKIRWLSLPTDLQELSAL